MLRWSHKGERLPAAAPEVACMLGNYFAAALRNLFRNRAYAAINMLGLAIGFAAAALRHE